MATRPAGPKSIPTRADEVSDVSDPRHNAGGYSPIIKANDNIEDCSYFLLSRNF